MKINERIRYHADALEDPTVDDITAEVARDIIAAAGNDRGILVALIADGLGHAVRAQLGTSRANATTAYKRSVTDPDPKASPSARFQRRTSAWARMLDTRIVVDGVYKRQGDCTVDDLAAAAAERIEHIAKVQWHVDRLNAFIAAMNAHGVDTLGELPEGAVDEATLAVAA